MKNSKKIFLIKLNCYKKLNLTLSKRLQLFRFKQFKMNLGWISNNRIIFLNFLNLFLLLSKGLKFDIFYLNIPHTLKKLNFVYMLAILLVKWVEHHKFFYFDVHTLKKLLQVLNRNIKKLQYNCNLKNNKILFYKRWSLIKIYK